MMVGIRYVCGIVTQFVEKKPIDIIEVPWNSSANVSFGFKPNMENCTLLSQDLIVLDHLNVPIAVSQIATVVENLAGFTNITLLDTKTVRITKFYVNLYSDTFNSSMTFAG